MPFRSYHSGGQSREKDRKDYEHFPEPHWRSNTPRFPRIARGQLVDFDPVLAQKPMLMFHLASLAYLPVPG